MKIYEAGTKTFTNNGLGQIIPIKCIETKKKSLNGWYLECEVDLKYKDIISKDNVVYVNTKEKGSQPFVMEAPEITDRITFKAMHVAFTADRYLLDDVRPTNLIGIDFLNYINTRTDTVSPFKFYSNISERKTKYYVRKTLFEALQEAEVLFGAVFDLDGFEIRMLTTIGNLSDTTLTYGKNISGVKLYENWDTVTTKLLPVGPDELLLPEKYIIADVSYPQPYTRTLAFDISKQKEDGTDKAENEMISELREIASKYIQDNKYPKVNYTVNSDIEDNLNIGDIIPVKHPLVSFSTDVQEYEFDITSKMIRKLVFGNYVRDVTKVFTNIKNSIADVDKKANGILGQAQREIQYLMNVAGKNGTVTFRKNDDGVIYEILAMDTKDIDTAKTILRINAQGIAATNDGKNGKFKTAMMSNGMIIAEMIEAGTLTAMDIVGGSILIGNNFSVDVNGNMQCTNAKVSGTISSSKIVGTSISNGLNFFVDANGNLQCINAKISGTITSADIFGSKFISHSSDGTKSVEIKDGAVHLFDLLTSSLSLSIGNNQVKFYDWKDKGNYVGSMGSLHGMQDGRSYIGMWCDVGDKLVLGCAQQGASEIKTMIAIDENTADTETPFIRNTASGDLQINNGTVTVQNGLIKSWNIPGAVSGYFFAQDGSKITVENGRIIGIG